MSISLSGTSIILKRQPSEIYIKNYNHEWILAWNGNLDIQICLDFFAVVTYITDYYNKSETKLTDVLVITAKENKDKTLQQRMRLSALTYLTHRKMGESEAYYRIFPFLHLKESNIKCTFVQSGFESKRHKFLIPAYTTKNENDCNEPSGEECDTVAFSHKFLVEGHESKGAFIEKPSVHDHYKRRPLYLEKMRLAQFAIMYDQYVKNSIKEDLLCGISSSFGSLTCHLLITSDPPTNNVYLPKFISCNSIYFKLRNYPLILRIHKYDQMKNPHEYAYSELCLFRPWRDENELEENNLVSCLQLWNTCPTECDEEQFRDSCVDKVKKKLFPNWSIVHQSRNIVNVSESQRLQHIGDCLDSQLQQDEEDDYSEGIMPHSALCDVSPPRGAGGGGVRRGGGLNILPSAPDAVKKTSAGGGGIGVSSQGEALEEAAVGTVGERGGRAGPHPKPNKGWGPACGASRWGWSGAWGGMYPGIYPFSPLG